MAIAGFADDLVPPLVNASLTIFRMNAASSTTRIRATGPPPFRNHCGSWFCRARAHAHGPVGSVHDDQAADREVCAIYVEIDRIVGLLVEFDDRAVGQPTTLPEGMRARPSSAQTRTGMPASEGTFGAAGAPPAPRTPGDDLGAEIVERARHSHHERVRHELHEVRGLAADRHRGSHGVRGLRVGVGDRIGRRKVLVSGVRSPPRCPARPKSRPRPRPSSGSWPPRRRRARARRARSRPGLGLVHAHHRRGQQRAPSKVIRKTLPPVTPST